jgi:hypothetical protein
MFPISPKVQNIFNQLFQAPETQLNPAEINTMPELDPNILAGLQPTNIAQQQLEQQINTMPQRQDFKPSPMTNIMGRLGGLSASGIQGISGGQPIGYRGMGLEGQRMIDNNLNRGYNQEMDTWQARLKPLGELADSERAANTNIRQTQAVIMRDQQATKKLEADTANKEARLQHDKDVLDQRKDYAKIVQAKNEAAGAKVLSDKNGNVYIVHPVTGKIQYLTRDDGTLISSDKLPDEEKLEIQQNNRLEAQRNQGEITRQNQTHQGGITRENQANQGEITRENQANQGGITRENQVNQGEVTKDVEGVRQKGREKIASMPQRPAAPKAQKMIPVIHPDGRKGTVPEDKLADALKKGFKVR